MRRNKYDNISSVVDNIRFQSRKESRRYGDLKLLLKLGVITDLEMQKQFDFPMGFSYRADFTYVENGKKIAEDAKGFQTPVFKLKKKCFDYFYKDWELRIV